MKKGHILKGDFPAFDRYHGLCLLSRYAGWIHEMDPTDAAGHLEVMLRVRSGLIRTSGRLA